MNINVKINGQARDMILESNKVSKAKRLGVIISCDKFKD